MHRVRSTFWVTAAVALILGTAASGQQAESSTQAQPAVATPAGPAQGSNVQQPQPASAGDAQPAGQTGSPATSNQEPASQEPVNDEAGTFVFKKQVEEVVLHATVVDDTGRLASHLDRSDFSVTEGGAPQTITGFRREDIPVAIGIVIDNSGSMRDKRSKVNQAVMNLIRASNPQDEIFVVNFAQTAYLDQDFTSDVGLLEQALHQTSMAGTTALYDAIVAAATHLSNYPKLDKKVLLVITDGQDNMSEETLQEAIRHVQRSNGPTLYAFGLMGGTLQGPGREALQSLASATGGAAFFPVSLDQVDDLTRSIAHDIRSQYTITYKPSNNEDANAAYHPIRVEARAPGYGRLTVRTRNGYYTGESVR